jgi:hypothetical protein
MNLIEKSPREFLEFNYYLERIRDSIPIFLIELDDLFGET